MTNEQLHKFVEDALKCIKEEAQKNNRKFIAIISIGDEDYSDKCFCCTAAQEITVNEAFNIIRELFLNLIN